MTQFRLLLAGVKPGDYPRGGAVHIRLWLAEQVALMVGAASLSAASASANSFASSPTCAETGSPTI